MLLPGKFIYTIKIKKPSHFAIIFKKKLKIYWSEQSLRVLGWRTCAHREDCKHGRYIENMDGFIFFKIISR
jgi:hypothetical protein